MNEFGDHQPEERKDSSRNSTQFQAAVNLFKGIVGLGFLSLPAAFSKSGWLAGIIEVFLSGFGILFISKQMITVASKKNSNARDFMQFCRQTLGTKSIIVVNISVFLMQIGFCIAYVIFFVTYFQEIFCYSFSNKNYLCNSRIPSIALAFVIILPVIFIKHMRDLKKWSMLANIIIVLSIFIISTNCFIRIQSKGFPTLIPVQPSTIVESFGIFIFAFEGVGIYFDIRYSMEDPLKFNNVLENVMWFSMAIYCWFGGLGYIAFGNEIKDIILFNFDMSNRLMFIVKIGYCISLIFSYPIQIFPCVNSIERLINSSLAKREQLHINVSDNSFQDDQQSQDFSQITNNQDTCISKRDRKRDDDSCCTIVSIGVRIGFIIIIFCVSIMIKQIAMFINLVGSACGSIVCYIIPVLIVHWNEVNIPIWKQVINWSILVMSIFYGIIGTYSSLASIIKSLLSIT